MKDQRILTENVNKNWIVETATTYFEGFTIYETMGSWNGIPEASLEIKIITDQDWKVDNLALAIKDHNKQQSVLVQRLPFNGSFI